MVRVYPILYLETLSVLYMHYVIILRGELNVPLG